ncbi:MAG: FAD-dependent oxidoreductase, partial [Nitrospirota bacterium]
IDALGGEMSKITDKAGIQFKILNKSKGPAVWATRVQTDRVLYRKYMRESLETQAGLDIRQESIEGLLIDKDCIYGIKTTGNPSPHPWSPSAPPEAGKPSPLPTGQAGARGEGIYKMTLLQLMGSHSNIFPPLTGGDEGEGVNILFNYIITLQHAAFSVWCFSPG